MAGTFLLESRYEEIAQLVAARVRRFEGLEAKPGAFLKGVPPERMAELQRSFPDLFQESVVGSEKPDTWALNFFIRQGIITAEEAEGFLNTKYPGEDRTKGVWANLALATASEEANRQLAEQFSSDSEAPDSEKTITKLQEDLGTSVAQGSPGSVVGAGPAVVLDDLPDAYDRDVVQEVVQSAFDQANVSLVSLAGGNIAFGAHSIDGAALKPGSVPATAMDLRSFELAKRAVAGPEARVRLRLARSKSLDRHFEHSDGDKGPGRIYRVQTRRLPSGYKPSLASGRFQIIEPGLRLGLMGMVHEAAKTPASEGADQHPTYLTYGCVIHGIPHDLGRKPDGMFAVAYDGDSPVSLQGVNGRHAAAGAKFFFPLDDTEFFTTPPVAFQAYNDTAIASALVPSTDYLENIQGYLFTIVTGQTSQEARAQLNGRFSEWFRSIRGNAPGIVATFPPGLPYEPPAPASLISTPNTVAYTAADETTETDGEPPSLEKWIEGVPFKPSDCTSLRPSETRFSLIVQLWPPMTIRTRTLTLETNSKIHRLSQWENFGVAVVETEGRKIGVDIIVY